MTTIKDIAEQAQVSMSTVSRILSLDQTLSVTDETRQRVLQVAEKLKYKKRSKRVKEKPNIVIGIIQWQTLSQELNDLYYLQIQYGVEGQANRLGMETRSLTLDEVLSTKHPKLDGLIMIGKFDDHKIEPLKDMNIPTVFIGKRTLENGFDCVTADFDAPVRLIINYYRKHQIDDIGILIGQEKLADTQEILEDPRMISYKCYLKKLDLFRPEFIFKGAYTPESGYELMNQAIEVLGDKLPHGFIIGSDAMAVGALRALNQHKISVPKRVNLVGFNDVAVAQFTTPALSTINAHTELMGKKAVALLKRRIARPERIPQLIVFASELIKRESSF